MKNDNSVRERIVEAGIKLFLANGFAGTSVKQLAEAAGVAKGTLYWHFKSKDQILEEIFDRFATEFYEPLFKKVEECDGDFLTKFKVYYKTITESALEKKELVMVCTTISGELAGTNTDAERKIRDIQMKFHDFNKRLLEYGKKEGTIPADCDTDTQAHILLGSFAGMHLQWYLFEQSFDAGAYARAYRWSILRGLGVKSAE
ncbi:MAG: HTH-type transcriptional regulator AcrR [Syntrophorhabdaceae bacterium PtaU1.Bin034]|jgi:AcrR family transcriptional regulator|nr:MAG: HTH-type transcriptional regulator AcrR [Syntrophorhabdaceae bacterium PtaU1.Bin034]